MALDKANTCYDVRSIIKQFNGKDSFMLWQRKMKNILIQQDLDETILMVEKKPTGITDEDWKKMDKKVKSFIELHLADNVILRVGEDMNAKETWEKLEKLYKRTTLSRKNELYSLQMEEGGDLPEHLRRFQNCVVDLSMMGAKYEDDDKTLLLMRSLPPSFKHFKSKIMSGGSTLLFDEVIDALQSYVKMNENSGGSQVQGLSAKVRSHSKGKQTARHRRMYLVKEKTKCEQIILVDVQPISLKVTRQKRLGGKHIGASLFSPKEDDEFVDLEKGYGAQHQTQVQLKESV
ncbi:hypothetical protein ACLB2K_019197 [Fragaria x ananassa]